MILASRVYIGGGLPSGVILADGNGVRIFPAGPAISVDPELISATPADDLIIDYTGAGGSQVLIDHALAEQDTTAAVPASGIYQRPSSSGKTNSAKTQAVVPSLQTAISTSHSAILYLKFV